MKFTQGQPSEAAGDERNFAASMRYRSLPQRLCPGCDRAGTIHRGNTYSIDSTQHVRIGCECVYCGKLWEEVYRLCGADQHPTPEDRESSVDDAPVLTAMQQRAEKCNRIAESVMGWHTMPEDPRQLWRQADGGVITLDGKPLRRMSVAGDVGNTDIAFCPTDNSTHMEIVQRFMKSGHLACGTHVFQQLADHVAQSKLTA